VAVPVTAELLPPFSQLFSLQPIQITYNTTMLRIEVQNQTQADAILYGLNSAIEAQAEFLTSCHDDVLQKQAEAFVWLRDNFKKIESKYPADTLTIA
jgi:hypothetical protein